MRWIREEYRSRRKVEIALQGSEVDSSGQPQR